METPWSLPVDMLLEVFTRSDPTTLVRFAATCRLLYRHITNPAFLRCYRPTNRFSLALFDDHRILVTETSSATTGYIYYTWRNANLLDHYKSVASRSGLLVFARPSARPRRPLQACGVELCVCNPMTGHLSFLPPYEFEVDRNFNSHVLLPGDGNDNISQNCFQLLVVSHGFSEICTQTFSSKAGTWGPVTETPNPLPYKNELVQPSPVVLRGVAHWLYQSYQDLPSYNVVSLNVSTGQAESIAVPPYWHSWRMCAAGQRGLLLVSSADGRLRVLVAEALAISVWTMTGGSWAREVVVERQRILQSVKLKSPPSYCQSVEFEWFGERSGSVIMQMNGVGMVLLNPRTKEFRQLTISYDEFRPFPFFPYELDVVSLLPAPKSF